MSRSLVAVLVLSHALLAVVVVAIFYMVPAIRYSSIVEPQVRDLDPQTFAQAFAANPDRFIFLDVRTAEPYDRLHAAGSKLQPLHTLYTERYNLPKNTDKTIVLICSGGVASGVAYSYLQHYGFRNIARVGGGIEAWQAAGLPVEGTSIIE